MIIFKDGTYESNVSFPDSLYDKRAEYWIEDNNALADMYKKLYPQVQITVLEESGKVVNVEFKPYDSIDEFNKIAELKRQLADEDYKIIKCYESSLVGKELPYDIAELSNRRGGFRDEINRLEAGLREINVLKEAIAVTGCD